jgi:hypothetical protein
LIQGPSMMFKDTSILWFMTKEGKSCYSNSSPYKSRLFEIHYMYLNAPYKSMSFEIGYFNLSSYKMIFFRLITLNCNVSHHSTGEAIDKSITEIKQAKCYTYQIKLLFFFRNDISCTKQILPKLNITLHSLNILIFFLSVWKHTQQNYHNYSLTNPDLLPQNWNFVDGNWEILKYF